jgi:hypothetical protein
MTQVSLSQEHPYICTEEMKCMKVAVPEYEHAVRETQKHLQEMETACKRSIRQRNYRRSTEAFPVSLLFLRPFYQVLNKIL